MGQLDTGDAHRAVATQPSSERNSFHDAAVRTHRRVDACRAIDEPDGHQSPTDDRATDLRVGLTASIIVVGYNGRPYLSACLQALDAQRYLEPFEIVFVDNASTDGSADYVRAHHPHVAVIESGANLGYAGGNNLGAAAASGALLVFVNPDTVAEPDWLAELVAPFALDHTVGMTTSKIVLMDQPDRVNACGNVVTLDGMATCGHAGELAVNIVRNEEVAAVSGAACAIRADIFRELGGFDDRFWMYLEDTDLSWRVRLAGYRCLLTPRSVIRHRYRFALSAAKTRVIERNRYVMLAKNLSLGSMIALLPRLAVGEVAAWGWAILQGPSHVWAKLRALGWALAHAPTLVRAHRQTQRLRRVADAVLLAAHSPVPPIGSAASGLVVRVSAAILVPLAVWLAVLALALIGGPPASEAEQTVPSGDQPALGIDGQVE